MRNFLASLLICTCALPTFAADTATDAQVYVNQALQSWAADPLIIAAVLDQNSRHAALTQADIDTLEKSWAAELGKPVRPTISSVIVSPTADLLRAQVEQSAGLITELFVMDSKGLNVASSGITSDIWQGDEAKFTETHAKGAGAVHVSEVEFDESTQAFQVQVSFTLIDPADGSVIGAITMGMNAELL
jgi:hypothetical protein